MNFDQRRRWIRERADDAGEAMRPRGPMKAMGRYGVLGVAAVAVGCGGKAGPEVSTPLCAAGATCDASAPLVDATAVAPTEAGDTSDAAAQPLDSALDAAPADTGAAQDAEADACALTCAGHCVNPTTDPANCGACGSVCPGATVCANGSCAASPPSCQPGGPGMVDCGPSSNESCCTSLEVPGGSFYRGYDGVTFTDKGAPATVSGFRLDKYEISVGRFRQFVNAVVGGWTPAAGSGKHAHLNGGAGLNIVPVPDAGPQTESGWNSAWTHNLATTSSAWDANLQTGPSPDTWTPKPGANETRPINQVTWYEAYAFCIWDGGFLPSETESNYAAAGGGEQRVYPWSSPADASTIDHSYASYNCMGGQCLLSDILPVGNDPIGNAKWGHADMAGNVWEWGLDEEAPYVVTCNDCINPAVTIGSLPDMRGGGWGDMASWLLTSYRTFGSPDARGGELGARCARVP